jgi:hypothetical protein
MTCTNKLVAQHLLLLLLLHHRCDLHPPGLLVAAADQLTSWDLLNSSDLAPFYLSNLAWAVFKLGCTDKQLYSNIAAAAGRQMSGLDASQVKGEGEGTAAGGTHPGWSS